MIIPRQLAEMKQRDFSRYCVMLKAMGYTLEEAVAVLKHLSKLEIEAMEQVLTGEMN